jgi:hypothetical protein
LNRKPRPPRSQSQQPVGIHGAGIGARGRQPEAAARTVYGGRTTRALAMRIDCFTQIYVFVRIDFFAQIWLAGGNTQRVQLELMISRAKNVRSEAHVLLNFMLSLKLPPRQKYVLQQMKQFTMALCWGRDGTT